MAAIRGNPDRGAALALLAAVGLPSADLAALPMENFFYAGTPRRPDGLVGLELAGSVALLRSLAVLPGRRTGGLGSALVAHAEAHAAAQGVHTVYLLTTTAESFFGRRGYSRIDRGQAPAAIRALREFSELCPASSAFMSKNLE